ncbi:MAG TPA: single-stranded-DNA-specific exonuclease RecJ [Firmicutes bacterium]|nr:single-stranded-DNA-specific exonuclease RecJ [Bacillota bacterium]
MPGSIWCVPENQEILEAHLAQDLGISPALARVLINRGVTEVGAARRFLHPEELAWHDPFSMLGMPAAVARLQEALARCEQIVVYGDYDVDGITAAAILTDYLQRRGGRVTTTLPSRLLDGYGLHPEVVRSAAAAGCTLLVTVDCGITACAEIALAKQLGMDVLVCDHHEAGASLPLGAVLLDPKQPACPYPFKGLAAVGVVWKLLQALEPGSCDQYLDLVALGTVADVVPLVDENRRLVQQGLACLASSARPGLRALLNSCGLSPANLEAGHVAFGLAPRLNAAGRVGDAMLALQLLLCQDVAMAEELAAELEQANRARQRIEETVWREAEAQAMAMFAEDPHLPFLVLDGDGWHPGVIGIVASRLVERFYRPTLLVAWHEGLGRGSGRSIPGFNLHKALSACAHLLEGFGGHGAAAGCQVVPGNLPALRAALQDYARRNSGLSDFVPKLQIDAELRPDECGLRLATELELLAPFGVGNPRPLFAVHSLRPVSVQTVGKQGQHLRLQFQGQSNGRLVGIGFRLGHLAPTLPPDNDLAVAASLEVNRWRGQAQPQLVVREIVPASANNRRSVRWEERVLDGMPGVQVSVRESFSGENMVEVAAAWRQAIGLARRGKRVLWVLPSIPAVWWRAGALGRELPVWQWHGLLTPQEENIVRRGWEAGGGILFACLDWWREGPELTDPDLVIREGVVQPAGDWAIDVSLDGNLPPQIDGEELAARLCAMSGQALILTASRWRAADLWRELVTKEPLLRERLIVGNAGDGHLLCPYHFAGAIQGEFSALFCDCPTDIYQLQLAKRLTVRDEGLLVSAPGLMAQRLLVAAAAPDRAVLAEIYQAARAAGRGVVTEQDIMIRLQAANRPMPGKTIQAAFGIFADLGLAQWLSEGWSLPHQVQQQDLSDSPRYRAGLRLRAGLAHVIRELNEVC